MNTIPLISSEQAFHDRVVPVVQSSACDADVVPIGGAQAALEYLNVERTDLVFINFSDPAIDSFGLLESIQKDPWLLHSSIVAFCDDHDVSERLEAIRSANIIVTLVEDELEKYLPRILDIVVKNQRILFQRAIVSDLAPTISGSYQLDNHLVEANCYANLLCNYLYNANKIDDAGKMHINLALTEMLINAIEHGNCGITYAEKGAWLDEGNMMSGLIEKKCQDPAVPLAASSSNTPSRRRSPHSTSPTKGTASTGVALQDPAKKENRNELHGRGIKLTRKYTKNLAYNDKGNQVSFEIEHIPDCANATPAVFENIAPILVKSGDVVFRQGRSVIFFTTSPRGDTKSW